MLRNIIYWIAGVGSLGTLFFAAPHGALITGTPARGKVTKQADGKKRTVRGHGPAFIFLGGGYHGGK